MPDWIRKLVEDPGHYAEVGLSYECPRRLGLRLFFEQLSELECLGLPEGLLALAFELQKRFDLVPGHWLRLGIDEGQVTRLALNYEVPPQNHYPISTLRVFLRRYGSAPPVHLESALRPALEIPDSRWGLTVDWNEGVVKPRIFGRIPYELLQQVGQALIGDTVRPLLEELAPFPASPWCYLSFSPAASELFSIDLEQVPLQLLNLPLASWPALPEPMLCPYAKFRGGRQTAYLPWPAFAAWWCPETEERSFLEKVRDYYDARQDDYLQHLGTTWQAGHWGREGSQASNLQLARRARIDCGMRILDAGCGVAGPALDLAQAYPGIQIDGLNLCQNQLRRAAADLAAAGMDQRIRLHLGDFHHLPFEKACFQRVLFLETSGYAHDRHQVFSEAFRVLCPGGMLYIKDVFRLPGPLRRSQWVDLNRFDRLYAQKTPTLQETLAALLDCGFEVIDSLELSGHISMEHYHQAMGDAPHPTSFGLAHGQPFRDLPLFFADVLAVKRQAIPG
ncbi:methyltransferase domain-containing protein [bacterium]|nr:methyltransferase domain-containing protein [bacterium]